MKKKSQIFVFWKTVGHKVKVFLNSEYSLFVFARLVGVFVKPLLLYLLLEKNLIDDANNISIMYLTVGSLTILFNNEAHFDLYRVLFQEKASNKYRLTKEAIVYLKRLLVHMIIFFIPVTIIITFFVNNLFDTIIFAFILVLEKLFDEVQRYYQFRRYFRKWSIITLKKMVIPFLLVVVLIKLEVEVEGLIFIVYMYSYFFVLINILYLSISRHQINIVLKIIKSISPKTLKNYFNVYFKKMIYNQLQSFSARNVPLLDRMLVKFFIPSLLPLQTLISQIATIQVLFFDYFLISYKRDQYIHKGKNVFEITPLLTLFSSIIFIFVLFITGFIFLENWFDYFNLFDGQSNFYFLTVGLYFAVFAVSQHFNHYNFWNKKRKYTLGIDMFFVSMAVIGVFINPFNDYYLTIVAFMLVSHIIRIVSMIMLSITSSKHFDYEV